MLLLVQRGSALLNLIGAAVTADKPEVRQCMSESFGMVYTGVQAVIHLQLMAESLLMQTKTDLDALVPKQHVLGSCLLHSSRHQ